MCIRDRGLSMHWPSDTMYIKAEVRCFPVVTKQTRLISYYYNYGLLALFTELKWNLVIETTRQFLWQWEILDLSLWSIKTKNWSVDNFKKHITSVSCTLQSMTQSCDTSQQTLFKQLSIDHSIDVHYQVKHRLYSCPKHIMLWETTCS